jgi:hypothetical protein
VPITNQFYGKGFCHNSNNPADPPYFAGPGGERIIYSYHPGSGSGVGSVDCLDSGTCCFVDSSRSGGEPGIYRCYFPCSEVVTPGATTTSTTQSLTATSATTTPKQWVTVIDRWSPTTVAASHYFRLLGGTQRIRWSCDAPHLDDDARGACRMELRGAGWERFAGHGQSGEVTLTLPSGSGYYFWATADPGCRPVMSIDELR